MSDQDRPDRKDDEATPEVNVSIGRDVSIAGGDIVKGDVVSGDKTTSGDTTDSEGVAIGGSSRATITPGSADVTLEEAFAQMLSRLDSLEAQGVSPQDIADAKVTAQEIQGEAAKGEEADEGFLEQRFRNIARMRPDILEVVTASLA